MKNPNAVDEGVKPLKKKDRDDMTPFPCGKCLPCKIHYRKVWSHRILLEASTTPDTSYVTFTYDDDKVPQQTMHDGITRQVLHYKDMQDCIKRLRKEIYPRKLRYYISGEYGDQSGRPHYHAALFGISCLEKNLLKEGWTDGFIQIGDLNIKTANYIAGYIMKKMTKPTDPRLNGKPPEFSRMSKGSTGGLGIKAIEQIGEALNKDRYFEPYIIESLKYGKKSLPLGRYLSDKLSEIIGISKEERDAKFILFQEEIFNKHLTVGKHYYYNVVQESDHDRMVQERKFKIFNSKRNKV